MAKSVGRDIGLGPIDAFEVYSAAESVHFPDGMRVSLGWWVVFEQR